MSAHTASPSYLRSRLTELEVELATLEERIQLVRTEHSTVAQTLDSIIYPILTVPTEIIDEIFISYIDSPRLGDVERQDGPLVLASVCRAWRTIVLSRKERWTSLHIVLPRRGCPISLILRTMASWIANAGDRLIDLDITAHASANRNALFAELPQYSTRLRSLSFQLGSCPEESFPNDALHGRFPHLEKLAIEDTMTGGCSAFEIAPLLRHVELRTLSYQDVMLPWDQIEHLVLEPSSETGWAGRSQMDCGLGVLRRTPSVKTLVADNPEWIVPALCANPYCESAKFLPNLDRLVIEGCHVNMDAPNLTKIIGQRWRRDVKRPARLTSLELTFPISHPRYIDVKRQRAMIAGTVKEITDALQELVDEGFDLVVHILD
ncbi:hypothetical protein C8F01DRAFT_127852 [Mycena amicta]|nr:hypothetical protein C8F01DRAFT_127852 [Mycena amicta]